MLALEVTLLTGRYVATAYNDRDTFEWPPHPARIYSALVATYHAAPNPDSAEREVLEWLETLGAPQISASEASDREAHTVFVPVNDTTLLGDFEDAQAAIGMARKDLDAARCRLVEATAQGDSDKSLRTIEKEVSAAEKTLKKVEDRMRAQIARAVAVVNKPSGEDIRAARQLFPEQRGRQPRSFPSVTPEDPNVTYLWPAAEPTSEQKDILTQLCVRVVRVGHSSSLARMRVCDLAPESTFVPDDSGSRRLRVFIPGQLARLEEQFLLHQETQPRVLPAVSQGYSAIDNRGKEQSVRSLFDDDWLVLELVGKSHHALSMLRTADVSLAVRGALQSFCDIPIPGLLSGHAPDGSASQQPHLAIVPLPYVGSNYADGRILGVALVFPRDVDPAQRRIIFRALANWEVHCRQEDEETPQLPLKLGHAGVWPVQRVEDISRSWTLRSRSWCAREDGERVWMSATPIALDRNPGELRSRNSTEAAQAFAAAEEIVSTACERIGLPRPDRVWVTTSAPLAGSEKARRFSRYPVRESKPQRVLVHATIRFLTPVRGPVILGAGRYQGLGLFRPLAADLVTAENETNQSSIA